MHFIILITIGIFINRLFLIYIYIYIFSKTIILIVLIPRSKFYTIRRLIYYDIYREKHIWLRALIYYIIFEKDKCHLVCQKLVESMPSRCQVIITNGWDWIYIYRINFFFLRYTFLSNIGYLIRKRINICRACICLIFILAIVLMNNNFNENND